MHGSRSRPLQRFLQRSKSAQGITPFVLREAGGWRLCGFSCNLVSVETLLGAHDCRSLQCAVQQIVADASPPSLRSCEHRVKLGMDAWIRFSV